jgi:hypothetical protein
LGLFPTNFISFARRLCEQYESHGSALAARLAAAQEAPPPLPARDPAAAQLARAKQLLQEALHLDENGDKVVTDWYRYYAIGHVVGPDMSCPHHFSGSRSEFEAHWDPGQYHFLNDFYFY